MEIKCKCGGIKVYIKQHAYKTAIKNGRTECDACKARSYMKERYHNNPTVKEYYKSYSTRWQKENKDRVNEYQRKSKTEFTFGLTPYSQL